MRISAYLHTIRGYSIIERTYLLAVSYSFYCLLAKITVKNEAKENEHETL